MQTSQVNIINTPFKVGDFIVNPSLRTITNNKKEVETVQPKVMELLCFLASHQGEVVKRDTIFDYVWKDTYVSEDAMHRTVSLVRVALNDNPKKPEYIVTIPKAGYQLIAPVEIEGKETAQQDDIHYKRAFLVLLPAFVLLWFLVQYYTQPSYAEDTRVSFIPINLTKNVTSENSDEWLFEAGLVYLTEMIGKNSDINARAPVREWRHSENSSNLAISLIDNDKADLVVLADVGKEEEFFISTVQIRGSNGIVGEHQFKSNSINRLMGDINNWVGERVSEDQIVVGNDLIEEQFPELSDDDYAVESFLRGLSAQLQGDAGKAINFFETSIEQDPDFQLAWYQLSLAERLQGNYQRSMGILNSLENLKNGTFTHRVANAKGNLLWRTGEYDKALASHEVALTHAKEAKNLDHIRKSLANIALVNLELGDTQAARKALDEVLTIFNEEKHVKILGYTYNTYARLEYEEYNIAEAIEMSKKAINAFSLEGNRRAETNARARLGGYLIDMNQFSEAETIVTETLFFREESDDRSGMISSYNKLGKISLATGKFDDAEKHYMKVTSLSKALKDKNDEAESYLNLSRVFLISQDLQKARLYIQLFKDNSGSDDVSNIYAKILDLRLAIGEKNFESAQKIVDEFDEQDFHLYYLYSGDFYYETEDYESAEIQYRKFLNEMQARGRNIEIVTGFNRLTRMYLKTDMKKAASIIDQTKSLNPFSYPYLKYKAMVAKENNIVDAQSLLNELKLSSNDFWSPDDQILLEQYTKLMD